MRFELKKFEDLYLEPSKNGLSRSSLHNGVGVKIVNMGELFRYPRMKNPEMRRVITTEKENLNFGLKNDDLIFARRSLVAEGAGKCSIILEVETPTVLESSIIRVRLNKKICSPLFYYYFFSSEIGFSLIQSIVNEVAASGIRSSELAKLKVIYPKPNEQYQIANILSTYDDLIETNNQRIKLLEETAQQLYKEWFVRMRFPEYKKVRFVKGVPEGWEVVYFRDFIKLNRGFDLPDEKIETGDYPVVASTSIKAFHNKYKVEAPCVATGRSGSLGVVQYINKKSWPLNTSLYVKDFKGNSPRFVYYFLQNLNLESFNAGAGVPSLNQNHLHALKFPLPPKLLQNRFDEIIVPIFEQIENLQQQNTHLRQIRDRLLPRLVSGQLAVKSEEGR